jgi:hypothetical protein
MAGSAVSVDLVFAKTFANLDRKFTCKTATFHTTARYGQVNETATLHKKP